MGSCYNKYATHPKFITQRKEINVKDSMYTEEVRKSKCVSRGNYLLKINGMNNNASVTNKLVAYKNMNKK